MIDLSFNSLFGIIPMKIYGMRNLTALVLTSNNLSGFLHPEIGNLENLSYLEINENKLSGDIPEELGKLKKLYFLDLSENHIGGSISPMLSGCSSLEYFNARMNVITCPIPNELPRSLQLLDISSNKVEGMLPTSIFSLKNLTEFIVSNNRIYGEIPHEIKYCDKLLLLDLGKNHFRGQIPEELSQLSSLEISLNLSINLLSGQVPFQLSGLEKLTSLDLSHNQLSGKLDVFTNLASLVLLNVSFNNCSGDVPNTLLFHELPPSNLVGNKNLNWPVHPTDQHVHHSTMKLIGLILLCIGGVLLTLLAVIMYKKFYARIKMFDRHLIEEYGWNLTLFQNTHLSIEYVINNLNSENVIGFGSSGGVYRVRLPNGETIAVKKMIETEEREVSSLEIQIQSYIRHRNIVTLLGWACNRKIKLLFFNYIPHGSLSSLLHDAETTNACRGKMGNSI